MLDGWMDGWIGGTYSSWHRSFVVGNRFNVDLCRSSPPLPPFRICSPLIVEIRFYSLQLLLHLLSYKDWPWSLTNHVQSLSCAVIVIVCPLIKFHLTINYYKLSCRLTVFYCPDWPTRSRGWVWSFDRSVGQSSGSPVQSSMDCISGIRHGAFTSWSSSSTSEAVKAEP